MIDMEANHLANNEVKDVEAVLNHLLPQLFEEVKQVLSENKPTKLVKTETIKETEYSLVLQFMNYHRENRLSVHLELTIVDKQRLAYKNKVVVKGHKYPNKVMKAEVLTKDACMSFDYYDVESLVELEMMMVDEYPKNILNEIEAEYQTNLVLIDYYLKTRQFEELEKLVGQQ